MKIILISIFLVMGIFQNIFAQEDELRPLDRQKYNVTITINYENVDLEDIANRERQIKVIFHDAKKIQIDFDKQCVSCRSIYDWRDNIIMPN